MLRSGRLAVDRIAQRRLEKPQAGDDPGRGDGIGDAGALAKLDIDQSGAFGPDVGDLHVHLACSFSARRTNASMNVFAIWLNTGPTIASIKVGGELVRELELHLGRILGERAEAPLAMQVLERPVLQRDDDLLGPGRSCCWVVKCAFTP